MKIVTVRVEQNGGEYYGRAWIECEKGNVEKVDYKTIKVDGMKIKFDEVIEVLSITDKEWKHMTKPRYSFEKVYGENVFQVRLKGEFVMYTKSKNSSLVDAHLKEEGFDSREEFLSYCSEKRLSGGR